MVGVRAGGTDAPVDRLDIRGQEDAALFARGLRYCALLLIAAALVLGPWLAMRQPWFVAGVGPRSALHALVALSTLVVGLAAVPWFGFMAFALWLVATGRRQWRSGLLLVWVRARGVAAHR